MKLEELLDPEGLGEVVVRAGVPTFGDLVLSGPGGEQHDRNRRRGRLAPHRSQHAEPVMDRHHHVEHDEIGFVLGDLLERLGTVAGTVHDQTLGLEIEDEQVTQHVVIVSDDDLEGSGHLRVVDHAVCDG